MLSLGWDTMSVSVRSESWGGLIFLCINLLHPPLIAEAAYLWVVAPGTGATFEMVVKLKRCDTVPALFCAFLVMGYE